MNYFRLFLVLLQMLTVLSLKCKFRNGKEGLCSVVDDCWAFKEISPPYTRCGKTGLYCCPLRERNRSSSPDADPRLCGQTPMYPIPHISGGNVIQPDEYSWLASLQYGNKDTYGVCGASVINSFYLLTAAHCVQSSQVDTLGGLTGVRLGDFEHERKCDYGAEGCVYYQQFEVEQTIVHENYHPNDRELHFDIALIRVKSRIPLGTNVKPICLPFDNITMGPSVGDKVTAIGWGLPNQPHKTAVTNPLKDNAQCKLDSPIESRQICADENNRGSCPGDSGGPLMYQFEDKRMVIEGIVSYGFFCGHPNSVYTRVRSYLPWIMNKIKPRF